MAIANLALRLIVGLGNPGPDYAATRHNAGFWLLDQLSWQCKGQWRKEGKFHGDIARIQLDSQEVWLLKPMTFMNRSGRSVLALAHFYKILPDEILVVHDELDLPPGVARFKQGGGHGGHNGLKDIVASLGSRDFWRLRLGIGHPGDRNQVVDFVLKKPPSAKQQLIDDAINQSLPTLPMAVTGNFEGAMKALHTQNQ